MTEQHNLHQLLGNGRLGLGRGEHPWKVSKLRKSFETSTQTVMVALYGRTPITTRRRTIYRLELRDRAGGRRLTKADEGGDAEVREDDGSDDRTLKVSVVSSAREPVERSIRLSTSVSGRPDRCRLCYSCLQTSTKDDGRDDNGAEAGVGLPGGQVEPVVVGVAGVWIEDAGEAECSVRITFLPLPKFTRSKHSVTSSQCI